MSHCQITHIEFHADDPARAQRFYSELFGWEFGEIPGFDNYFMFNAGQPEHIGGAIGKRGDSVGEKTRLYIETDSIDAVLPRVPGLGGTVITDKAEIPGQGWYAVIQDSERNEVGLYENLPES